jgi:HD-GYP domain-containing protein (c-di-GMP phosphodiesterase class II)
MVKFIFKRLRWSGVTMSAKIIGLLMAAVVFSTGLAGWLIYDGLRDRAWIDAEDALLQAAVSSSVGMGVEGLDSVQGPGDLKNPAYVHLKHALHELYQRNHFDLENRGGRLSVLRFVPTRTELVQVASMDSDADVGRTWPVDNALFKAVATHEAVVKDDVDEPEWLVAYAPLDTSKNSSVYVLKLERSTLPLHKELVGHLVTIVLGALAGLVLTLVSGWLVTGQITKPLRTFVDVMRLMQATGDFDMKIDLHPEDRDMSVVESTFQSLVRRMQDSREREEQSHWSTLQALVTALDVRDNETAGHSMRVTRYSLAIGERMRLRPDIMDQLRQGALLHDVGKIGVPDAILRKAGRLTAEEWLEMRKHPTIGKTFLEDIAFLRPAMAVVYSHHERWDGTGYPQGLVAEAIPLTARVFAVADALDAITSQRYYKEAISFREAQIEIEACASTHFDPVVVKSFLSIPEKVFMRIRQETSRSGVELERLRRTAA